jgi:two-component system, NtrC family, sensor histidine kinase HydH
MPPFIKRASLQPKTLLLIFFVLASLMVASALIELYQSRIELLTLMSEQAHSFLESLIVASQNALAINEQLEKTYRDRLLSHASIVKTLYEQKKINNTRLNDIATQNNLFRINIFNRLGEKMYTSHPGLHPDLPANVDPQDLLFSIFEGEQDTLIIGMKPARLQPGYRYVVALATNDRGAIVLNADAREIIHLRQTTGFGILLRKLVNNPGIIYVALQDTVSIIAASGKVTKLEAIRQSSFLDKAYTDSLFLTRSVDLDSLQVFEAVHPFSYENQTIGLFRLGLSLEPVQAINHRIYYRLIIITLVLVVTGFIMFTFILIRQRYDFLQKRYREVETFSSNIIQKVGDAVIVHDWENKIKIVNRAAEILFGRPENEVRGLPLGVLFPDNPGGLILNGSSAMQQISGTFNRRFRYLLISRTTLPEETGGGLTILVIRDLTDQKRLEEQVQRKERLSAMGQLASGVAHEIRNPLNTIGTIVQQLDKDFEPVRQGEEYHQLAGLVYKEVRRINDSIEKFLKFSRPEPIQPVPFVFGDLLLQLQQQYHSLLASQQIQMKINLNWNGVVTWDPQQMKQVFMNLIQNALEAINQNGWIQISVNSQTGNEIEISVYDNGPGIPEAVRSKIFNLYFTTKARGTGIGLSIVQRIILEHDGIIGLESQPGQGSNFILRIPVGVSVKNK